LICEPLRLKRGKRGISMNRFRAVVYSLSAVFAFSICLLAPPPAQAQATGQWRFTGSMASGHGQAKFAQLANGRVLAIGGDQGGLANGEVLVATGAYGGPTCGQFLSSAELYNPATGQWTYTGSTLVPREGAFAIRLADGRVLLAGGYNSGTNCTDTDPVDTEIY